jgi:hypothetical protein
MGGNRERMRRWFAERERNARRPVWEWRVRICVEKMMIQKRDYERDCG